MCSKLLWTTHARFAHMKKAMRIDFSSSCVCSRTWIQQVHISDLLLERLAFCSYLILCSKHKIFTHNSQRIAMWIYTIRWGACREWFVIVFRYDKHVMYVVNALAYSDRNGRHSAPTEKRAHSVSAATLGTPLKWCSIRRGQDGGSDGKKAIPK